MAVIQLSLDSKKGKVRRKLDHKIILTLHRFQNCYFVNSPSMFYILFSNRIIVLFAILTPCMIIFTCICCKFIFYMYAHIILKITTNYDNVISHKADKIMASFDIIPKINSIETMSLWLCIKVNQTILFITRGLVKAIGLGDDCPHHLFFSKEPVINKN